MSLWKPYLDLLPDTYTCPVCMEQDAVNLFPEPLRRKAHEQREVVRELYLSSKPFFIALQPLFPKKVESLFNYEAFRWAWCTINTRTVYLKHMQKECFSREADTYALAPYLDLLNHNPDIQVRQSKSGFSYVWVQNGSRYWKMNTVRDANIITTNLSDMCLRSSTGPIWVTSLLFRWTTPSCCWKRERSYEYVKTSSYLDLFLVLIGTCRFVLFGLFLSILYFACDMQ